MELLTLQIVVSVMLFTYKVMVLADKKAGWLLGAVSATLGAIYFYRLDLYVYTVLDIGLIVLMGYAFMKKDNASQNVEDWLRLFTGIVMLALAIFAFSGLITVVEFLSSIGLLIGTVLLTHGRARFGWLLYAIAHFLAVYLGYAKDQQFFADLQLASAIVSLVGMFKKSPRTS